MSEPRLETAEDNPLPWHIEKAGNRPIIVAANGNWVPLTTPREWLARMTVEAVNKPDPPRT